MEELNCADLVRVDSVDRYYLISSERNMQIIKENIWNKLTKSAAIEQQHKMLNHYKKLVEKSEAYMKRLTDCQSLLELLKIHKELWAAGYQNKNLGPNPYGMFRTDYISTMTPNEVFLGNIFGLVTFSIAYWEKDHTSMFGMNMYGIPATTTYYEIVLRQYKQLLKSNVKSLVCFAEQYIREYKKINP